ncbi:hypothetical protein F2Q69_00031405 [Brassica cretica]|uniref:Uncharacterized protein n=1 Tax=Brassica cretica TaxID=69181 RepID=A0A8S9RZ24_BRACR|nr:hypothetical protein F2Q69_00031405 [Brassica cretica]
MERFLQCCSMFIALVNSKKRDFIGELYVGSKRWRWFRLDFEESLDEEMLFVIHLVGFVVSRRLAYAISDKTR